MSSENKKQILKILKSKIKSSSFIMLPNINRSEYLQLKLVWLFLSLFSASWCVWFMSKSILDYLNYDVISKTDIKYETHLLFPIITL